MATRRSRVSATRSVVDLVAVVLAALLGAGTSQAAMGGALPLTSTFRPDLRTVTLVASNAAQFCFDKVLNGAAVGPAKDFRLGGYDAPAAGYDDFTSASRPRRRCRR